MTWQDPSADIANVNAAYVTERDDSARLRAALEDARGYLEHDEADAALVVLMRALDEHVTPREVTARADVARVEHLQQQMGDES